MHRAIEAHGFEKLRLSDFSSTHSSESRTRYRNGEWKVGGVIRSGLGSLTFGARIGVETTRLHKGGEGLRISPTLIPCGGNFRLFHYRCSHPHPSIVLAQSPMAGEKVCHKAL
jgi:hypothetical protein